MNNRKKTRRSGKSGGPRCPIDGKVLRLTEFPDTGTSVDCYEGKCANGHTFNLSYENQTGKWVSFEQVTE